MKASLSVHRRSVDRHGSGEPDFRNGQTLGGVKVGDWRDVSGSPSKVLEAKDGEDQRPGSGGS
jgi:hypothetical protein